MNDKKTTTETTHNSSFTTHHSRVPRLRFPEFRGMPGWEVKKLGGITKFSSGNTPSKNKAEFWGGDIPWISASSMHDSRIDSSNYHITTEAVQNGAQIAPKGTILLLVRGSMLHKRIPIGIASREVAFNQDVKSLSIHHDVTNTFLLFSLISKERCLLNSVTKTGIGAGKLDTNELKALEVEIPNKKEQQKIADCLSSVDALIGLQGRKVEQLARHKQALLQQLFPNDELSMMNDERTDNSSFITHHSQFTPRLRFPEYRTAPAWEEKRLGDVYGFLPTNSFSRDKLNYETGRIKNIHYGDIHKKFSSHFDVTKEVVPYVNPELPLGSIKPENYCVPGDMVIADASEDIDDIGKAIEIINTKNEKILSGLHTIHARQKDKFMVIGFAGYLFQSEKIRRHIHRESQGAKVLGISPKRLSAISINFPVDHGEQQKIANCLSSLDTLIDLNRRKLEALKRHKQGLMQQLFPNDLL